MTDTTSSVSSQSMGTRTHAPIHDEKSEIITKVVIVVLAALVAAAGACLAHLSSIGVSSLLWEGVTVASLGGATFLITMALLINQCLRSCRGHKNQDEVLDEDLESPQAAEDASRITGVKSLPQAEFVRTLKELDTTYFAQGHNITHFEYNLFRNYAEADQLKKLTQAEVNALSQKCCLQLLVYIPADQGHDVDPSIVEMLALRLTDDQKLENIYLFARHAQTVTRGDTFKRLVPLFLDKWKNHGEDSLPEAHHFVFLKHFPAKVREWLKENDAASHALIRKSCTGLGVALPGLLDALDENLYSHVVTAWATQWREAFNVTDSKTLPAEVEDHEIFTRLVTDGALFKALFSKDAFKEDTEFMFALLTHAMANPSTALAGFKGAELEALYALFETPVLNLEHEPLAEALAKKIHQRGDDVNWHHVPYVICRAYLQHMTLPEGEAQAIEIMKGLTQEGIKLYLTDVARIPTAFCRLDETTRKEVINGWLGDFSTNVAKEDPIFALVATELELAKTYLSDKNTNLLPTRARLVDGLLRVIRENEHESFIQWLHENNKDVVEHFYKAWNKRFTRDALDQEICQQPLFISVHVNPEKFKEMVALLKEEKAWMPFVLKVIELAIKDANSPAESLIGALDDQDFDSLALHLRDQVADTTIKQLPDLQRRLCHKFDKDPRFTGPTGLREREDASGNWRNFDKINAIEPLTPQRNSKPDD